MMSFDNTTFLEDATMLCGADQECLYDALATRNLVIGENTKVTGTSLQDEAEALCKSVLHLCVYLLIGTVAPS